MSQPTSPNDLSPAAADTAANRRDLEGDFEILRPPRGWQFVDLAELWRYRRVALMLARRDLKVRYKQTIIGASWALLRPLAVMVVCIAFFHLLGRVPAAGEVPYAVTLFCALLPWQFFATVVQGGSGSLLANEALLKKVYLPRAIFPALPILSGLVDFALAFAALAGLMIYYSVAPTWAILALPPLMVLAAVAGLAVALWLSAANAVYRDVQHAVPFLMQVWFFLTPVIYETEMLIAPQWQPLYALNPMVGIVEGFRWAVLGQEPAFMLLAISVVVVLILLLGGALCFRRLERIFVDWI